MKPKKPMKGDAIEEQDFHLLKFPLMASPKLDGFRCLKLDGKALSSNFKPIRNVYTREWIEENMPDNIDGELLLADPKATFNQVSSAFSAFEGEPDFVFHAFDYPSDKTFKDRYLEISSIVKKFDHKRLKLVKHTILNTLEELLQFESECIKDGHEGIMIRSIEGPYKSGKSTVKQGWLLKLKRFVDSDAEIIDFLVEMTNNNEATKDECGRTKRSSKQEYLTPANTLGKFLVRDIHSGVEFEIGTGRGLTDELRKEIWDNQERYSKLLIKYQYQKAGVHEKPRFPSWLGFRPWEDIS